MADKKKKDTEKQEVVKDEKQLEALQNQLADALKKVDETEKKAEETAKKAEEQKNDFLRLMAVSCVAVAAVVTFGRKRREN